ncbi:MAG: hypothetical protein ACYCWE_20485 [Eubacteriales bacterium]
MTKTIRNISIYFKENMSNGFNKSTIKEISIDIEPMAKKVRFDDLRRNDKFFVRYNHNQFETLLAAFNSWFDFFKENPYKYGICKKFNNINAYLQWRGNVYFVDEDVRWRLNIEFADGSLLTYINTDYSLPGELEEIYNMVKSMQ